MIKKVISSKKGTILFVVMSVCAVLALGVGLNAALFSNEVMISRHQINSIAAFQLAESGIDYGINHIDNLLFGQSGVISPQYTFQLDVATGDGTAANEDINVEIIRPDPGELDLYQITSSATVGGATRTLQARVFYNPPSLVFDYSYFINNWGWWYGDWDGGSKIKIKGDVRSNGTLSVAGEPKIDGEIYAAGDILYKTERPVEEGDIRGKAGTLQDGEFIYQHPFSNKLNMPNLGELAHYEERAITTGGRVSFGTGGGTTITGVYGDDTSTETGDLYLEGTNENPIEISGIVVVRGDVIIKGKISGTGTIYAGRNIYIADNLKYHGDTRPDFGDLDYDNPESVDVWVEENYDKDIVGLAASENIILGDYITWPSDIMSKYLSKMGNEDVGLDGVPGTGDEGEGDGDFSEEYEDLDGDGIFDDNYNIDDVRVLDLANFHNLPTGFDPSVQNFSDLSVNDITKIQGILFTNHAITGRIGDIKHNGSWISKDEATFYGDGGADGNNFKLNYDPRVHSRYLISHNGLIDIGLPTAGAQVLSWSEINVGSDMAD